MCLHVFEQVRVGFRAFFGKSKFSGAGNGIDRLTPGCLCSYQDANYAYAHCGSVITCKSSCCLLLSHPLLIWVTMSSQVRTIVGVSER